MLIRDPLYGDLVFSESESKLINTASFDRMRRIKQLSFSEYVYPSATHNRYSHSLGTCEIASNMFDILSKKHKGYFNAEYRDLLRMIALSHDIGHSPFSHASDRLSTITHEDRIQDILKREGNNVELTSSLSNNPSKLISDIYNGTGLTVMNNPALLTLRSLMDNFIDADKIDYLIRDAYYCGVRYGNFDRNDLIKYLTLIKSDDVNSDIMTVGIEMNGLQALESFILARYYMFNQVYFNPTRRLYDMFFLNAMNKILPNGKYPTDTKKFLAWDDSKVITKLDYLYDTGYELVCDIDYNAEIKHRVDRDISEYVLCDTPRKEIYRKNISSPRILVHDTLTNKVSDVADVSVILKSIEFASIHKLRYYAPVGVVQEVKDYFNKLFKEIGYGK